MAHPARDSALYVVLRSFLGIGGRLPLRLTRSLGPVIGSMAMRAATKERRRVSRHLEIAFPELDRDGRHTLMQGCAKHFGNMLAEVAWMSRAGDDEIEALCPIVGYEHFTAALERGRGVMFTTAHCGNWELLSARLPIAGTPLTTAVRELQDPRIGEVVNRLRSRFGTEVVLRGPTAGRQLARALRRNRVVGLLIDQDIRDIPGVFVPFFGRPAWTPSGAAMLAIRMGCPVVPGFIHRLPDGTHRIVLQPALEKPTSGSVEDQVHELTAAATAATERQIRAYPEQWVWMHRRWRTQPGL